MANGPKYDGTDGGPIDLTTAKRWTANYRVKHPGETEAHYFGRDLILRILAEGDCSGIRIYYAIDDKGNKQLLLVGTNSKGNNLLPQAGTAAGGEGGDNQIGDVSFPCPPYCPDNKL
ncbi:MAG: hypothetical protein HRU69_12435 [Flammeovirgaceae bacterium]|nr:MAG: hypothetical protein HRU69_12435 [Flammeovirgaceae bacterium]